MTSKNTNETGGPDDDQSAWIDALCDRFEDAWGTDKQFSIEFVLAEISADKRDAALKALLQVEVELRAATGDAASAEELQRRFPKDSSIVDTVLQNPVPDDSMVQDETIAPRGADDEDSIPNSNALRIPRQLGRYRIIRKLGQGAMGSVFLAHDEQLDRQVALKIPRGDLQRNREMRLRFEREAQAAAALHHPNICPIHDIGEFEGIHYICMGYIEGFSLTRYAIAESGLSEQRIAELVLKMAKALAVAHEAGFIHRDLKPANVMVDHNDEPVILDFGLARRVDRSEDLKVTQTGTTLGSPAYMSPEQADGDQDKVGPQSDVYSLGVILYELLTGRIPFEGSLASVLGQIMTKEPEKPSDFRKDLSVRLENICQRMMAKDPAKRHPSMHAVVAGLQEYLDKFDPSPQPAAVKLDEPDVDQGQKRREQITKLIATGDYSQAEKLLVALSRETDPSFVDAATWAAAELPKLRKTREEVRAGRQEMYSTASRFMKSYDYEQAVQLLEEYPYDLRTPKMQQLLEEAEAMANEVKLLRKEIRTARKRGDNAALLPLLNALLEIKPGDRRANELREQLTKKSVRPLSRAFGKQTPKVIDGMSANVQWVMLFAVAIAIVSYPAYQWSANFLKPNESPAPPEIVESDPDLETIDEPEATTDAPANQVLNGHGKAHSTLATPGVEGDFAIEFDMDDRVEVKSLIYDGTHPITMEAWVKLPATGIGWSAPLAWFTQNFDTEGNRVSKGVFFRVQYNEKNAGKATWFVTTNDDDRTTGVATITDRWTHAALVVSSRDLNFFLDGKLVHQRQIPEAVMPPDMPFLIGEAYVVPNSAKDRQPPQYWGMHDYFGLIDEIRVSRSVRYTSDFTPERRFSPDEETLALFHCDEGNGDQLIDSSSNENHGTVQNIQWAAVENAANSQIASESDYDLLTSGETYKNAFGMAFVRVPEGRLPGTTSTIIPSFYIQTTEVTQSQWFAVMTTRPWQSDTKPWRNWIRLGVNFPAVMMTAEEASEFCERLTELEQHSGTIPHDWKYDLPGNAEAEYACRAGSSSVFHFGDTPSEYGDYAWFKENATDLNEQFAHEVAQKKPNSWGLFDTHGNVCEWCRDGMTPRLQERGGSNEFGSIGGSFFSPATPAEKFSITKPNHTAPSIGFRPILFRTISDSNLTSTQPNQLQVRLQSTAKDASAVLPTSANAETVSNSIGMTLRRVPAGSVAVKYSRGPKELRIENDYYLATTEVTKGQWKAVMEKSPRREHDDDYPKTGIAPAQIAEFCRRLGFNDRVSYRLPSPEELEYALRAGFSDGLYDEKGTKIRDYADYAWFGISTTKQVARKTANYWGFHDLLGNAGEWTNYVHRNGNASNSPMVADIFGGSFKSDRLTLTTKSFRTPIPTSDTGFRVAVTVTAD